MMGTGAWERLLAKAQGVFEANPQPPALHVILQTSARTQDMCTCWLPLFGLCFLLLHCALCFVVGSALLPFEMEGNNLLSVLPHPP